MSHVGVWYRLYTSNAVSLPFEKAFCVMNPSSSLGKVCPLGEPRLASDCLLEEVYLVGIEPVPLLLYATRSPEKVSCLGPSRLFPALDTGGRASVKPDPKSATACGKVQTSPVRSLGHASRKYRFPMQ